jgi:hypothetical protein
VDTSYSKVVHLEIRSSLLQIPAAKTKLTGQMTSFEVDGATVVYFRPWPSGLSRRELLVGEIRNVPLNGQYISRMMKIAAEGTTAQLSRATYRTK